MVSMWADAHGLLRVTWTKIFIAHLIVGRVPDGASLLRHPYLHLICVLRIVYLLPASHTLLIVRVDNLGL